MKMRWGPVIKQVYYYYSIRHWDFQRQFFKSLRMAAITTTNNHFQTFSSSEQNGSSPSKKFCNNMKDESAVTLKFKKLTENAFTPTKGSEKAAGFDLYSAYDCVVPAKDKFLVKTDLQIALPDGCYGRVAPRSGLAVKKFIDVGAGVIDQDYRGNVGVVLFNFGNEEFVVKKGDRVAQLVLERIFLPELQECSDLEETDRGSGGFGSTGTN